MTGAIILAAGQSKRFGAANKLTTSWHGKPLVRHVYDAAVSSRLDKIVVVTGHEETQVRAVLPSSCNCVHNGDFARGMAGSIRTGIYALQGLMPVMILLGDMPLIQADHINKMIDAFESAGSQNAIVMATSNAEPGNPVLFGTDYFAFLKMLEGDIGARKILKEHHDHILEIETGDAAQLDFDVPDSFET